LEKYMLENPKATMGDIKEHIGLDTSFRDYSVFPYQLTHAEFFESLGLPGDLSETDF